MNQIKFVRPKYSIKMADLENTLIHATEFDQTVLELNKKGFIKCQMSIHKIIIKKGNLLLIRVIVV